MKNKPFTRSEEDIVFFAFRYALGRQTGAVDIVCDHLKDNWNRISRQAQEQIKDEIRKAINEDRAGCDCDVEDWEEILECKTT